MEEGSMGMKLPGEQEAAPYPKLEANEEKGTVVIIPFRCG